MNDYVLSLPSDLTVLILAYLKARDILAFSRCCRFTRDLVVKANGLQYQMALEAAGLEDTQASWLQELSVEDRLGYIESREEIWRKLELPRARRWTIRVTNPHSHVHSLSSGLCILRGSSTNPQSSRIVRMRYLELPKSGDTQGEQGSVTWKDVPLVEEVLNIGLSLEEHDLIAALSASNSTNAANSQSFRLHLKKFSTGEPHPMAREHTIYVCEYPGNGNQRVATIVIGGPYLLLLMKSLTTDSLDDDFFVYDWPNAILLKRISIQSFTYRDVSFLSTDTFILTNIHENTLELLKLRNIRGDAPSDKEVVWVAKLALPPLRQGRTIASLSCYTDRIRGKQGARGSGQYGELGPYCKPDKALVQFQAYIHTGDVQQAEHMKYFSFVVHREVILSLAQESAWADGVQDHSCISAVSWYSWGPKATRWSGKDYADTAWMANIAGQRNVVNSGHIPRQICVRDYNAFSVNRMLSSKSLPSGGLAIKVVTEESTTAHQECFLDDIQSSLPYVEYTSSESFSFDAVLISDDHIIGLTENDDSSVNKLDVFLMTPENPPNCASRSVA